MKREHQKWRSPALGRDMELLTFGHAGHPVAVFPTSMGRFWDYEERGMVDAAADLIEAGRLTLFCLDSVDAESWYDKSVPGAMRAARHAQYDRYVLEEVMPHIRAKTGASRAAFTGCSFGGYHTMNFTLRHPEFATHALSFGGAFDIRQFTGGHYDDNCYFHCPPDFLPNLADEQILGQYRAHLRIVLAAGEHDICLPENHRLANILGAKGIPHWLDVWGGAGHDWPWWRDMVRKFFPLI